VVDTLHIHVRYSTEDEEYGPVYVACCDELGINEDFKTLDELLASVRETLKDHLQRTHATKHCWEPQIALDIEMPYIDFCDKL
jgi:hypothetical protein